MLKIWSNSGGLTVDAQERNIFVKLLLDGLEVSQLIPMGSALPLVDVSAAPTRESHLRRRVTTLPVQIPGPSAAMAKAAVKTVWKNPSLSFCCLMCIIAVTLDDAGLWFVVPCRMILCIPRFCVVCRAPVGTCRERTVWIQHHTLLINGAVGCSPYTAVDLPS